MGKGDTASRSCKWVRETPILDEDDYKETLIDAVNTFVKLAASYNPYHVPKYDTPKRPIRYTVHTPG